MTIPSHMLVVHEKVRSICENCGKKISFYNYTKHLDRCTSDGVKKFKCTVEGCDASFLTKGYRTLHINRIHKANVVKCPREGCGKYFKPHILRRHLRVVHCQLKKTCQLCEKQISLNNFKNHVEHCASDGVKRFECSVEGCSAIFASKRYRDLHTNRIHDLPKKCPFKNCESMLKPYLIPKHLLTCHGVETKKKKNQVQG